MATLEDAGRPITYVLCIGPHFPKGGKFVVPGSMDLDSLELG